MNGLIVTQGAPFARPSGHGLWAMAWRRFRRHRMALGGIGVLAVIAGSAVTAPLITSSDPTTLDPDHSLAPPSREHLLGTDDLGRDELARVEPLVKEVKALQNESDDLRRQLKILTGEEKRVTVLLKELSDVIPTDAYLTSINLRGGRLTLDGMAHSASDLIAALEKSKHFKNVSFTSPTTRSGDKDRFSLSAEVVK